VPLQPPGGGRGPYGSGARNAAISSACPCRAAAGSARSALARRRVMNPLIARSVLVLAAGSFVHVGVTWTIAYRLGPPSKDAVCPLTETKSERFWNRHRPPEWDGSLLHSVRRWKSAGRTATVARAYGQAPQGRPVGSSPSRAAFKTKRPLHLFDFRYGWPFRSVRMTVYLGAWADGRESDPPEMVGASTVPLSLFPDGPQLWPLRPAWPAFLANTGVFGLLVFSVIFGRCTLRSFLRLRQGRCLKCGYPIGTSPRCTECGTSVKGADLRRT
jgi:hypothetical protein